MPQKPNILFILIDQAAWKALPAYGNRYAQTPHINRIFDQGAAFNQAYTPCPLCQPARAAFWTGLYPHQTGILSNGRQHPVPPLPAYIPTLGELFKNSGYRTVHFGKQHDAGSLRGFELEPQGTLPVEPPPALPLNADTFEDRYTTVKTAEFLSGSPQTPFFAIADLNNPHNICGWVGENAGAHTDLPVQRELPPLPDNFNDPDFQNRPLPIQYICCSHRRLAQAAEWNDENYRHYLAAYYRYLELVDAEVGRILDALERRPDASNTLVVLYADHGDSMAAHRSVTKQVSLYEETTRVSLIMRGPGVQGHSRMITQPLVSLLDLFPTLCELAGISLPFDLWGKSLAPWLGGQQTGSPHDYIASEWHTEWGFTIEPGRMIRTTRYKYTRYLEGHGEELYDLLQDPGETTNRWNAAGYQPILEEHRRLLDRHLRDTGDPFMGLSWLAAPRWRSHTPGYAHHRGPSAPTAE